MRERTPQPCQIPERGSKLDPSKDYVAARLLASGLSAVRLFEEIKTQGYSGSASTLRRFISDALGFSRMIYSCFTTSMDLTTLINCHKAAFDFFGGLPKEVLYDNMKQVRLILDKWNPLFLDFANHYGHSLRETS